MLVYSFSFCTKTNGGSSGMEINELAWIALLVTSVSPPPEPML